MIAVVVLMVVGLVVEQLVVTNSEQVAATLQQIAKDLESNDVPRVVSHISTESENLRREAESILKRVKVQTVSVKRNLTVSVVENGDRKTAIAKFNAVAKLSDSGGAFGNQLVPRFFIVNFVNENGQWRITQYEARMHQEGT